MALEVKQSPLKVLVCDDDAGDRKLTRAYLRKIDGREIVPLEAGQRTEIQRALDRGSIDLILMDVQMPEKSGLEWLAEIVERQAAPVVMLTGSGSEEVAVQALREGAVGYLPKNKLSAATLANVIDDAIRRWREMQQSKANQAELERMAYIDSLTGLYNKRAIIHKLCERMKLARRYGEELSVIMLDIDHFKKVNDQYGHIVGDDVLEKCATLVRHNIRDANTLGRYGGEEFIIFMPHTDSSSAQDVAERIRKTIESAKMTDSQGSMFSITISQGLASYKSGDDEHSLIGRADAALYAAKDNGRNRVEILA